jgi:hypothetical protein
MDTAIEAWGDSRVVEGELLATIANPGRPPKYLLLATETGIQTIELAKSLRKKWLAEYPVGSWLKLATSLSSKSKSNLKAKAIVASQGSKIATGERRNPPKGEIKVCTKSACARRGGKATCAAIAEVIANNGWEGSLQVKEVGCLGACKQGPAIVTPDRKLHRQVTPEKVKGVLDRL